MQSLQMLHSIRSERLLMEEIDYSVLFRWFVGLNLDEEVWDATTCSKNRDPLQETEVAKQFLAQVVEQAQSLTSDEHFTVDGTLLEAWAGAKSRPAPLGKGVCESRGQSCHNRRRPHHMMLLGDGNRNAI